MNILFLLGMGYMLMGSDPMTTLMMACCGFTAFIYFLYTSQESLLYQPRVQEQFIKPSQNPAGYKNPGERGMRYQDVYIHAKDKTRLHCWWIHHGDNTKQRHTILYLHANAGNMGFRLDSLQQLHQELDCNIFILSYRGYGESQGKPGEEGIMLDAEAALDWVLQRADVDKTKILLFGRSLGGAVATALASTHSSALAGVILENTFTSISGLVNTLFPFVRPFKKWVLKLKWESIQRITTIDRPILFLSGLQDEVVPCNHMRQLYEAAGSSSYRQLTCFAKGKHNDTWKEGGEVYLNVVRRFLRRIGRPVQRS